MCVISFSSFFQIAPFARFVTFCVVLSGVSYFLLRNIFRIFDLKFDKNFIDVDLVFMFGSPSILYSLCEYVCVIVGFLVAFCCYFVWVIRILKRRYAFHTQGP